MEGVGEGSGAIPPGDEEAEEDALGIGAEIAVLLNLGDSLLLVDSDL